MQIKGSRKSGRKVIIYLVNAAIKLIHQLLTARPRPISQHNVKMTIWSKSCLPSFSQCGCGDGGARWRLRGVWTLGGKGSNSLYIRERRDQKAGSLEAGGAVPESLLCLGGVQVPAVCTDVEHRRQTHFPILTSSCPVEAEPSFLQKTPLYQRRRLNCLCLFFFLHGSSVLLINITCLSGWGSTEESSESD